MNERIRELKKQAYELAVKDSETNDPASYYSDRGPAVGAVIDKFAELLVKECIQVCKSRVGNSDYTTGRMHCVSDLKEHFGVEE
jgi:hypothetical protein